MPHTLPLDTGPPGRLPVRRFRGHDRDSARSDERDLVRGERRRYGHAQTRSYDRDFTPFYGRDYSGPYGRDYTAPYDIDYTGADQDPIPDPWGGIYPPVPWGGGAVYGLEGGGPSPFELYGRSPYDDVYDMRRPYRAALRRPPSESPAYGRQADEELRRWVRVHGYDAGYAMRPRSAGGRYRWRGRERQGEWEGRAGRSVRRR